jgi:hypothetical protein
VKKGERENVLSSAGLLPCYLVFSPPLLVLVLLAGGYEDAWRLPLALSEPLVLWGGDLLLDRLDLGHKLITLQKDKHAEERGESEHG